MLLLLLLLYTAAAGFRLFIIISEPELAAVVRADSRDCYDAISVQPNHCVCKPALFGACPKPG